MADIFDGAPEWAKALHADQQRILRGLTQLGRHLGAFGGQRGAGASSESSEIKPASDRELAGQYGDPEVKKNPKRWRGESFVGSKLSDCPIDFLEEYASFQTWAAAQDSEAASKATGEEAAKLAKNAKYARQRASLALGWIERKKRAASGNGASAPVEGVDDL